MNREQDEGIVSCPACGAHLHITYHESLDTWYDAELINRDEWKAQIPPKKLMERLRREVNERNGPYFSDDSTASQKSLSSARAREEASDDDKDAGADR